MDYFDEKINRRNTYSLKWNVEEDELPMWVADMDFKAAPEILEALKKKVDQGIFGYSVVPNEWYEAYQYWWKKRHHFVIKKDWLIFCTGVVPAISSTIRKLTTPNEKVVLLTPVYNIFFNSIINNGCQVVECPLQYKENEYSIDFTALENCLKDPQVRLLILCNPHNPIGKIWSKEELEKIGKICEKYHILVLSDEIHCDIIEKGQDYVPFASINEWCRENSIMYCSPSKAFNLAGLQTAAVIVPNDFLRHKIWRALNTDEIAEPNSFAISAVIAAYKQSEKWLNSFNAYIDQNREIVQKYIFEEIPIIKVISSKATYLIWIDCKEVCDNSEILADFIRRETGLYLCAGSEYGKAGEGFLRMNVACSKNTLLEGLNRLKKGIEEFRRQDEK